MFCTSGEYIVEVCVVVSSTATQAGHHIIPNHRHSCIQTNNCILIFIFVMEDVGMKNFLSLLSVVLALQLTRNLFYVSKQTHSGSQMEPLDVSNMFDIMAKISYSNPQIDRFHQIYFKVTLKTFFYLFCYNPGEWIRGILMFLLRPPAKRKH